MAVDDQGFKIGGDYLCKVREGYLDFAVRGRVLGGISRFKIHMRDRIWGVYACRCAGWRRREWREEAQQAYEPVLVQSGNTASLLHPREILGEIDHAAERERVLLRVCATHARVYVGVCMGCAEGMTRTAGEGDKSGTPGAAP